MQTAWEDYAYREDIIEIAQRAVYPPRTPAWAKLPMGVAPQSPAERKEHRERLKKQAAEARVQAKQEARDEKRRSLEGPLVELPALVLRDGTVVHLPLEHVPAILRPYLPELCVDVESTGYQLGHVHYALRTVQLGGEHHAVVFDADDPVQMAVAGWAMRSAEMLHAFSASADLVPCVNAGIISWDEAWAKMRDGVNYAKLTDPAMTGSDAEGLKALSHDVLGDYAVSKACDEARQKLFVFNKTLTQTTVLTPYERSGWAQVNKNSTTMIRYAGSDVLDLAATLRVLAAKLPVSGDVLVRECEVQAMTSRVAYEGAELDLPHIKLKITEHEGRQAVARAVVQHMSGGAITNPSSAPEVLPALQSMGYELKPDRKTKQPSAGKGSLEPYAAKGDVLAKYILEYRHCTTTLGLLLRPLENLCEQGDGRMRPTVYTLEARTGRMCIPEDHALVTPVGSVPSAHVKPGMTTMDAAGNWVKVLSVQRYADAPVLAVRSRGVELRATPEHRWLTTLEHRPAAERVLRTLDERPRLRIHLAPEETFDFESLVIPAHTDSERFAAVVGMLVTDGTCKDCGSGTGLRAKIYQTEKKFYGEFMRVIPADALMCDTQREMTNQEINGRSFADTLDLHEIRLKARWLRPALLAAGLDLPVHEHLRDLEDLYYWAARLPLPELRAFFSACWLADGNALAARVSGHGKGRSLSCGSANLRKVITLAALRLGYVTTTHQPDRPYLIFREPVVSTNRCAPQEDGTADVWCVTTETGTFTGVSPTGTAYVTGNSTVRPNSQQFSRQGGIRACVRAPEGYRGISADFSGCEILVAAALSGDRQLYEAETSTECRACKENPCACGLNHTGLHWLTAHTAKGSSATKEDRYNAKRGTFTRLFGGGPATAADQVGTEVRVMEELFEAFNLVAPAYTAWDQWLRECFDQGSMVWRDYETGQNYSVPVEGSRRLVYRCYSGRNVYVTRGPHAAGNGAIQGTARELLVDGLLRWRETAWGNCVVIPIHDEVAGFVREDEAEAAVLELQRCMATRVLSSPGFEVFVDAEPDKPWTSWQDSS